MPFQKGHRKFSDVPTKKERQAIAKELTREDLEPMLMAGGISAYERVENKASKTELWKIDPKLYMSSNQWLAEMALGKSKTAIIGDAGKPIEFVYRVIHSVQELPKVIEYKQIEDVKDEAETTEQDRETGRDEGTISTTSAIITT